MRISDRLATLVSDGDGWGDPAVSLDSCGSIGEHDIPTHPRILEEMHRAARGGHTGYAAVPGTDALRDKVAAHVTERSGVPTGRGNVLITPGGQSGLFAAHMLACAPGDRGLFIDPYYATYPGTIRAAGALPVPVAARAEDGFQPDPARIAAAAAGATSLLINTPNNPTGILYDRDRLQGLVDLTRTRGLWLISDEVYDTMVWEGRHLSPRALPGARDHTLVVGSMSKSHAMTAAPRPRRWAARRSRRSRR